MSLDGFKLIFEGENLNHNATQSITYKRTSLVSEKQLCSVQITSVLKMLDELKLVTLS